VQHASNIQYVYLLTKYIKCNVWRLAVRYDIYVIRLQRVLSVDVASGHVSIIPEHYVTLHYATNITLLKHEHISPAISHTHISILQNTKSHTYQLSQIVQEAESA
jgi:hypothetical protein